MSAEDRAREVAESSCGGGCDMCADYIRLGEPALRPATRDEYLAALRRSYPDGIPADRLPRWARQS